MQRSGLTAVRTTGSLILPPEPRALEALGRNHSLEAAIAELVDNSIDASAEHVLIRFVRDGRRLIRLLVVDDGSGMDEAQINTAMTVGGSRAYQDAEIGRFGLGLKAASFSQARSVTVVSRSANTEAIGRAWQDERAKRDYACEVVDPAFAAALLAEDWGFSDSGTGTVVRWDDVKGFPAIGDEAATERFLQSSIASIRSYLGLVFHRILESGLAIYIDVEDAGDVVVRTEVQPLDPFGYPRTGAIGWPKSLVAGHGARRVVLECHIWPGRSNAEEFRLDGATLDRQGLYVYYNERLIQRGGWNGLSHPDKQLNLARVAVHISGDIETMLVLKPEKNGIEVGPAFVPAVHDARSKDGATFASYLEIARGTLKEANRRRRVRAAMLPAGRGFDPRVRRAFKNEFPQKDEDPVDIRWRRLAGDDFFLIDRESSTLWLNSAYRTSLAGGRTGTLNDLPVVKALLFLLVENIFAGQNLGPRDRDNLEVWQEILTAAAKAETR